MRPYLIGWHISESFGLGATFQIDPPCPSGRFIGFHLDLCVWCINVGVVIGG